MEDHLLKSLKKMDEFLDSEEGKAWNDKYFGDLKIKQDILESRFEKFHKWLENNSFDLLMDRLIKEHDETWRDKCYARGYEPSFNNKLQFVQAYIESIMDPIVVDEFVNDFGHQSYFFKGYYFTTYCGQGCFTRIHNSKKEEILQE